MKDFEWELPNSLVKLMNTVTSPDPALFTAATLTL